MITCADSDSVLSALDADHTICKSGYGLNNKNPK
jgi:hypothetical protein